MEGSRDKVRALSKGCRGRSGMVLVTDIIEVIKAIGHASPGCRNLWKSLAMQIAQRSPRLCGPACGSLVWPNPGSP